MLKLSFWIGTPSIITYLASTNSQTPGKYLLYLCFVDRGAGRGDPVADQREVQALGVIGNPPNAGGLRHPRFLLPAGADLENTLITRFFNRVPNANAVTGIPSDIFEIGSGNFAPRTVD